MASANRSAALGLIGPVHQVGLYIPGIENLNFLEVIFAIFRFVELPLGSVTMEMRHALAGQRGRARGQKKFQTLDRHFSRLRHAADIEPQDAEGQGSIN
jgi:hypothetical protein